MQVIFYDMQLGSVHYAGVILVVKTIENKYSILINNFSSLNVLETYFKIADTYI